MENKRWKDGNVKKKWVDERRNKHKKNKKRKIGSEGKSRSAETTGMNPPILSAVTSAFISRILLGEG